VPLRALLRPAHPRAHCAPPTPVSLSPPNLVLLPSHPQIVLQPPPPFPPQIVFHPSEWSIKPIALNPSIEAPSPTERLEPRALPFKPHSAEALLAMWPDQIEAALLPVVRSLGGGVAGIPRWAQLPSHAASARDTERGAQDVSGGKHSGQRQLTLLDDLLHVSPFAVAMAVGLCTDCSFLPTV
jgi:hypothetical protein